jgi:hypothetical protein
VAELRAAHFEAPEPATKNVRVAAAFVKQQMGKFFRTA